MESDKKTRQSLDGDIVPIRRGVAIYKIHASPFYMARVLNPSRKPKYVVRSTKETSRIQARIVAEEIAQQIQSSVKLEAVPREMQFRHFAEIALKTARSDVERGARNPLYAKDLKYNLESKTYGLDQFFGQMDVRQISVKDYADFSRKLMETHPNLSPSVHGALRSAFRNVMKVALYDGVIPQVPAPPKLNEGKNSPRPFFRFHPLVAKDEDQYKNLIQTARKIETESHIVRGIPITSELGDIIIFTTHTFLRPTVSELYALTHQDVTIEANPQRLLLTIKKGKTGYRVSNSMPAAVDLYKRMVDRLDQKPKPTDYVFLPAYKNRTTARTIIMRQFAYLLKQCGLEVDPYTNLTHSMYSLRHTALCMRLVLSDGTVNMEVLARNA